MEITYIKKNNQTLLFQIILNDDENRIGIGQGGSEIELLENTFSFDLPVFVKEIHPDLIALTLLTIVLPWVKTKISFPVKISTNFAELIESNCGLKVIGVNKSLSSRSFGEKDAVSFSGGVDSVAVTQIIPDDSVKLMFLRKDHENIDNVQPNYSIVAQKQIIDEFENAYYVKSDIEHIVGPMPQYPTWTTLSTPCFLLADYFNLKSINYGSIVGSSDIKDGKKFKRRDYPDKMWASLFRGVGIYLSKPVAGITEIGTSTIVHKSGFDEIATSCQFGAMNEPCMRCFKCFRKYLMNIAVNNYDISEDIIDVFLRQKNIQEHILGKPPLYFQHIFMYALKYADLKHKHVVLSLFREKILLANDNIEWCERQYDDALDRFVPDSDLRDVVRQKMRVFLKNMDRDDVLIFENWDLNTDYNNDSIQKRLNEIDVILGYIFDTISSNERLQLDQKNEYIAELKNSASFQLGDLFFRSVQKPYKLLTYPYNFIKILLKK